MGRRFVVSRDVQVYHSLMLTWRHACAVVVLVWLFGCRRGDENGTSRSRYCHPGSNLKGDQLATCTSKKLCARESVRCYVPSAVWCWSFQVRDPEHGPAVEIPWCFTSAADCKTSFDLRAPSETTIDECVPYPSFLAPIVDDRGARIHPKD